MKLAGYLVLGIVVVLIVAAIIVPNLLESCIVEGTPIDTPYGSCKIEDLRVGDEVWTRAPSGELQVGRVQAIHASWSVSQRMIGLSDGTALQATAQHPVATSTGWKSAGELEADESVWSRDGWTTVASVTRTNTLVRVFDLQVEPNSNFFASGVLVHNKPVGVSLLVTNSLRNIVTSQITYRATIGAGNYAPDLATLSSSKLIDSVLGSGSKDGYVFTVSGRDSTFTATATPLVHGETGIFSYFTDETGVIHSTREDRRATADDPTQGDGLVIKLRVSDGAEIGRYLVALDPDEMVFDGTHVWVQSYVPPKLTLLRVSDGVNMGEFYPGFDPTSMAFDGAGMWVTAAWEGPSEENNRVFKLSGDGTRLAEFTVGLNPTALASDGDNMWVANHMDATVTKLRASDGVNLGTFDVGNNPSAMVFDGANIWVASRGSWSSTVTKLRASDGVNLGTFRVGNNPSAMVFDGANIWVASRGGDSVSKLRASDGENLGVFPVGSPGDLEFDGTSIWVVDSDDRTVVKLRARDGAELGRFSAGYWPRGVAFDGVDIWVASLP